MNICLLRHATAEKRNMQKYPNDDRPLTKEGVKKMRCIAAGIRNIIPKADLIISSPMLRCKETAKILKKNIIYKKTIIESDKFLPASPIIPQVKFIKSLKANSTVFVVGHEPELSMLLQKLLHAKFHCFEFKKGGLALIMLGNGYNPVLKEFISPNTLIRLSKKKP